MAHTESKQQNKPARPSQRGKKKRVSGDRVIYPNGVQLRYGVSSPTRWRWEKTRQLPPRDVFRNGVAVGWRPETLEAADRGQVAA
jgi:predicted DNA-binding transcriptional regulator AlpA